MAGEAWPIDASSGAPSYTAQEGRQLFSPYHLNTTTDAFGVRAGRRIGAGMVATCPTTTTWQVTPGAYVAMPANAALQGPYLAQFGSNQTGTVNAQVANPRIDILQVRIDDAGAGDGSGARQAIIVYKAGTASGSPVAPALDARCNLLATINVPATGGGSPTVTMGPVTVSAGGLLPVPNSTDMAAIAHAYGLTIIRSDQGTGGRFRSNGSAWIPESAYVDTTPGAVVVSKVIQQNIIPGSGSQIAWSISGWASAPIVTATQMIQFAWDNRLAAVTSTQINMFITNNGSSLPDGTTIVLNMIGVGIPTPGSVPTL